MQMAKPGRKKGEKLPKEESDRQKRMHVNKRMKEKKKEEDEAKLWQKRNEQLNELRRQQEALRKERDDRRDKGREISYYFRYYKRSSVLADRTWSNRKNAKQ